MSTSTKKVVNQETLRCCGYKKCPTVKQFDDGSIELSDDDTDGGSVGTIKMSSEQVDRLRTLLK